MKEPPDSDKSPNKKKPPAGDPPEKKPEIKTDRGPPNVSAANRAFDERIRGKGLSQR
jgi:hypothetical protein